MLFRVVVNEIESWLLADAVNISKFLRIPLKKIARAPEQLADPKQTLTNLARRSTDRKIREGVAPVHGAREGREYNPLLRSFVEESWSPVNAAKVAPSLLRAMDRLARL